MVVYVLMTGLFANYGLHGVYESPLDAMDAWKGTWTEEESPRDAVWTNDLDWDDAGEVIGVLVQGSA